MSADNRRLCLLWGLGALVAAARWLARPAVPDGYDAFGFALAAGERWDLALFQPQFPGYPVTVALGRLFHLAGLDGLSAATAVSALASGAAAACLGLIALALADLRAALAVIGFHLVAWQPWLAGSAALSESPGMALAAATFAAALSGRPALAGALAGLLLGARASYFALLPALFWISPARRLLPALAAASLAWAAPFTAWIGPRPLFALAATHLRGHFGVWGGSLGTRHDLLERAADFARDLFYDGIAPSLPALLAGAALALGACLLDRRRGHAPAILAALAPYAAWAFLAQNLAEQPRHLLPLAEGLLLLLALLLAQRPLLPAALAAMIGSASLPLALERIRTPPAAAQAARWVAARPDAARELVAAGRSARFFRALGGGVQVQEHAALSDLLVSLARMEVFPSAITVTSEVDLRAGREGSPALPPHFRLEPGPRFCRDPRIDRAVPCLGLSLLTWSPR